MKVVVIVTGSVAATLTPRMAQKLIDAGHEVRVIATERGQYFFDKNNVPAQVWGDKDEWPEDGYHKGAPVEHIDFGKWGEVLLIAPLSAHTLGKLALGLCDNFATCIVRAWPRYKYVVIGPAMNTNMWTHPVTAIHILLLKFWYKVKVVGPVKKRLACGDLGMGAMADIDDFVKVLENLPPSEERKSERTNPLLALLGKFFRESKD